MDRPWGHYTKWRKTEKDKVELKKKQTTIKTELTGTENRLVIARGEEVGRGCTMGEKGVKGTSFQL